METFNTLPSTNTLKVLDAIDASAELRNLCANIENNYITDFRAIEKIGGGYVNFVHEGICKHDLSEYHPLVKPVFDFARAQCNPSQIIERHAFIFGLSWTYSTAHAIVYGGTPDTWKADRIQRIAEYGIPYSVIQLFADLKQCL